MRAAAVACLAAALGAPALAATPPATVTVQPGDSLARIAERTLGSASLWPLLYRANRDRIKDPERVYPGQELTVPPPPEAPAPPPGATSPAEAP